MERFTFAMLQVVFVLMAVGGFAAAVIAHLSRAWAWMGPDAPLLCVAGLLGMMINYGLRRILVRLDAPRDRQQ